MITKILICIIVILLLVLIITLGYNFLINRAFILEFIDGSWVDSDGNLVIISVTDSGDIDLSFGTATETGDYEVISDIRECQISKVLFKQEYEINLGEKTKMLVVPSDKKIVFYKKGKPLGEFYSIKMPKKDTST